MFGKRSPLYSILFLKCPRCHEGDLFLSGSYDLKRFTKMPEHCPVCGQRYELEPNFWQGAMFVSYGLQVALIVAVYVALRVLFNPEMEVYLIGVIVGILLLFPVILRLSRAIYIHLFVKYRKSERDQ